MRFGSKNGWTVDTLKERDDTLRRFENERWRTSIIFGGVLVTMMWHEIQRRLTDLAVGEAQRMVSQDQFEHRYVEAHQQLASRIEVIAVERQTSGRTFNRTLAVVSAIAALLGAVIFAIISLHGSPSPTICFVNHRFVKC